ncbi:hypothetical protein BTVI_108795 [Pitangus sulphuratus]|nr:hypothetical protein BTVI_108795 [Pitangus sulphuratus]
MILVQRSPLTSVVTWKGTVGTRGIAALRQGRVSWWEMVVTSDLPSSKSPLGSCEQPPPRRVKEVPTKVWDKPPYPHGTPATYTCRPGYIKHGRIMFQCNDGVWQQQPPLIECRNKPCGHPGDAQFGSFELTMGHDFVFGARVEYRCNDGYQMLSQRNYRECQADGWSNDIPHCEVVKCLPVEAPENGKIIMAGAFELDQEYSFGQVVNFECNAKYKLVGAKEIICSSNGRWSDDMPQCQEVVCSPPVIQHGIFGPEKPSYEEGDTINVECNSGYRLTALTGRSTAECTKNGWVPIPACVQICKAKQIQNGSVPKFQTRRPYKEGDTAAYTCHSGYQTEHEEVTCTRNGWSPHPRCIREKKCETRRLENGYFTLSKTTFRLKEVAPYRCQDGFVTTEGEDEGETQCRENGWTPPPKCIIIECAMLELHHGYFSPRKDKYLNGDVVTFSCAKNFVRMGFASVQCYSSGWFPSPPVCKAPSPQCELPKDVDLVSPDQHPMSESRTDFHEVIHYRCASGDENTKQATCVSGKWTPEIKCPERPCLPPQTVECADPPRLENPNLKIEKEEKSIYLTGAKFKYVARSGYTLNGSTEITCTMGEWTAAPACLEMSCGSIPKVAHAQFEGRNTKIYEPGETILYRCDAGFQTVGSPEIICREGNWTAPPSCEDTKCKPPPEIAGGRINMKKSKYLPGETANYECWQGFKMTGTSTVVCQNGIWTELPKCKGRGGKCGTPSGIESGEILSSLMPEYEQDTTLEYKCPDFYVLEGSQYITCTDGKWSNPPVCLVACTASKEDMDRNNIELRWSHRTKLYSISGDTIEFQCKPGYLEEQGISYRVKCVEGVIDYPRCRPIGNANHMECIVNANHMENNNIQLQSGQSITSTYRSGTEIFFECKKGYRQVSKAEKFSVQCEDGEIRYPTCTSCSLKRRVFLHLANILMRHSELLKGKESGHQAHQLHYVKYFKANKSR